MKKIPSVVNLLRQHNLLTKVKIFFSTNSRGEDYDPYEDNTTFTDRNPLTLKVFVREFKAESLSFRPEGQSEMGTKEIITEDRYANWFRDCNRIEIDGDSYEVYKDATGGNATIQVRPHKILRVIIVKKKGN